MTIDSIYNSKILDYAGNIPRIGRLQNPDGSGRAHSKLCGSTVTVDIAAKGGFISDYAHDVKACALGQASSSIFAANAIGCDLPQLERVRDEMNAMLKEEGEPPSGKFAELKFLQPVKDYRARHASTMLVFEAAVSAMKQALGAREGEREGESKSAGEGEAASE